MFYLKFVTRKIWKLSRFSTFLLDYRGRTIYFLYVLEIFSAKPWFWTYFLSSRMTGFTTLCTSAEECLECVWRVSWGYYRMSEWYRVFHGNCKKLKDYCSAHKTFFSLRLEILLIPGHFYLRVTFKWITKIFTI